MTDWTTPEDVAARVRRRWDDGTLLAAYVQGTPCPVVSVPIKGPAVGEIGAELARVQAWRRDLIAAGRGGAAFQLLMRSVGGRAIGRNEMPVRAEVTSYPQAWRLLGVTSRIVVLDEVIALTRQRRPELLGWLAGHARQAIEGAAHWAAVLAALDWLAGNGGRGLYLRQIEAPGVDTKFVTRHRALLAALLDVVLPPERVDQNASRGEGFAARYGFAAPPRMLRLRCDEEFAGLPRGVGEVAWRPEQLAAVRVSVQHVLIVENEVTYLSVPVPTEGVVIWGEGYLAGRLGRLPWVRSAPRVTYSGDLDTHGFAILNLLRTAVPQTRSLLMDRDTLLAHRDRWGQENSPTRARLDGLTGAEHVLYQELVEDVHGASVRLEQERLAWPWVSEAVEAALEP